MNPRRVGPVSFNSGAGPADMLLDPVSNEQVFVLGILPKTFCNSPMMSFGSKSRKVSRSVGTKIRRLEVVQNTVTNERCYMR